MSAIAAYLKLPVFKNQSWYLSERGLWPNWIYCPGKKLYLRVLENVLLDGGESIFPHRKYLSYGAVWRLITKQKTKTGNLPWLQKKGRQKNGLANICGRTSKSYFIQRMERFLKFQGKNFSGWDEIFGKVVWSGANRLMWVGPGVQVVWSFWSRFMILLCFILVSFVLFFFVWDRVWVFPKNYALLFDSYQGTKMFETLAWGGKIYAKQGVSIWSCGLRKWTAPTTAKHVLGGRPKLSWTNCRPIAQRLVYGTYPRLAALAEAVVGVAKQIGSGEIGADSQKKPKNVS